MEKRYFCNLRVLALVCFIGALGSISLAQKSRDNAELAQQFVVRNEAKLQEAATPREKYRILIYLAPAALSAGNKADAKKYAEELIVAGENIEGFSRRRYEGYAKHVANTVLGILALDKGDIGSAKNYLLASGTMDVSGVTLSSFGPAMELAQRLLEKGESETVLEYFDLCAKFWTLDTERGKKSKLARWTKSIQNGEMPNFGPSAHRMSVWMVVN